jgi:hypothetical protein
MNEITTRDFTPHGYLRFSHAVSRLADGIWGGLPRPVAVVEIKEIWRDVSVVFGPWREQAGKRLTAAVMNEELAVYMVADPRSEEAALKPCAPKQTEPLALPLNLLRQLLTNSRGILTDHVIRPMLKTVEHNLTLFHLLTEGLLVVRASDFDVWYRSERGKGKWSSQRSRSRRGNGRPTKQTEGDRNAVFALVRSGSWSGKESIAKLHRILKRERPGVPSPDTLARMVDELHRETGDSGLLRTRRARPNQNQGATSDYCRKTPSEDCERNTF